MQSLALSTFCPDIFRILSTVTGVQTVRVAAIQATPVILDGERSVESPVRVLGEAVAEGAQLWRWG
jgi:hypothetical protein